MILNAAQIREWDKYTITNEPITSIDLMERAARECTKWILSQSSLQSPVNIFCGKGNNGGDGLAIARLLLDAGIDARVYILESGQQATDDFNLNLQRLQQCTDRIQLISAESEFPSLSDTDLLIDALFGSGLSRPLEGTAASLVQFLNNSRAKIISIDVPSGMFLDQSSLPNTVIKAAVTLTFQVYKLCLLMQENAPFFGEVHVLNLGLHPGYLSTIETKLRITEVSELTQIFRPRSPFVHKGNFGHALIVGGSVGKTGAAIIASEACLHAGAGLTSVHLLSDDYTAVNVRCPEVMTVPGDEMVKKNLQRYSALGLGPGLGTGEMAQHLLRTCLAEYPGKLLLDADALNVMASASLSDEIPPNTVLTPHPKEFDRLFGKHDNDFQRLNTALTQSLQQRSVIVLKSHHTLIAYMGKGYFNTTGNAGLAKGGSGDALTGVITALMAQGYEATDSARLGVWLHGTAADIAIEFESEESLTVSDVVDCLGAAFKKLRGFAGHYQTQH